MAHDFKLFPELSNSQMQFYYFESPHRQITEDFFGEVVDVHDGDTIKVKWSEREKPVIVRLLGIAAAELDEKGGRESQRWLENQILGEYIQVAIDPKLRVGKWGRILGNIISFGQNINQASLEQGYSATFIKEVNL